LDNKKLPIEIPELLRVLRTAIDDPRFQPAGAQPNNEFLTVRVNSFSYKFDHPVDPSGNGGGFVFDCRFVHNPGRYEPYKKLTGRDQPVIDFLNENSNMADYLNNIYQIVDEAVENYIERSFTNLMVNFGCTGGQHRSVYAADMLADHLRRKYGVKVILCPLNLNNHRFISRRITSFCKTIDRNQDICFWKISSDGIDGDIIRNDLKIFSHSFFIFKITK